MRESAGWTDCVDLLLAGASSGYADLIGSGPAAVDVGIAPTIFDGRLEQQKWEPCSCSTITLLLYFKVYA